MAKVESSCSQNPESYDIWESGFRNYIYKNVREINDKKSFPLIPSQVMDITRSDQRWLQHVNYQYMALELILSGTLEFRTEHETVVAEAGMLYVVAKGSNVRIVHSGKCHYHKLTILISGSCLDSITSALGFNSDCLLKLSEPEKVEQMIREIEKGNIERKSPEYLSVRCYELLLHLKGYLQPEPQELRPALDWIAKNPTRKIYVPELARKCGLSETTLRRKFNELFGMSPAQYMIKQRLTLSRDLLKGKSSIKEISAICGFSSSLHFAVTYKKFYGESPSCTRKKIT